MVNEKSILITKCDQRISLNSQDAGARIQSLIDFLRPNAHDITINIDNNCISVWWTLNALANSENNKNESTK